MSPLQLIVSPAVHRLESIFIHYDIVKDMRHFVSMLRNISCVFIVPSYIATGKKMADLILSPDRKVQTIRLKKDARGALGKLFFF